MLTKKDIKILEKKYGFFPQKKLGQNFLVDANVKNKLLSYIDIDKDDVLLEIGSGLGQLTFDLSKSAKKVIAVEFDRKLFSILSEFAKGYANIILVHDDFLRFNIKDFVPENQKIKIISNLPYYISTPVILKLFVHNKYIDSAFLTLQRELADRLVAEPSTKDYSSFTLFAEFHAEIKRLFNIKKTSFYPVPKVDSTVIFLKMRTSPPVTVKDKDDLFELIRASFSMRRKTLSNNLVSQKYKGLSKEQLKDILNNLDISPNIRSETLRLSDFARIVNSF